MNMLEDSASYLDGTIYNIEAKVTNFDQNESLIQMMIANAANTTNNMLLGTISQSQPSVNSNGSSQMGQ